MELTEAPKYTLPSVPPFVEPTNFGEAIVSHFKNIELLKKIIEQEEARMQALTEAANSKLFRDVPQYDSFMKGDISSREEIQKRQEEISLENQRKAQKYIDNLEKNIPYWRSCAVKYGKYGEVFNGSQSWRGEILKDRDYEKKFINIQNSEDLTTISILDQLIELDIITANRHHNEKLLKHDKKQYKCPNPDCKIEECHAYTRDKETSGCKIKVKWSTKDVDFLNSVTIYDINVHGKLEMLKD